jgi:GDPmannose 4,6-dehydratase
MGLQDCLYVGNLSAQRDWGHAKDYIEAMWLMLQQDKADDYVLATGITTQVRQFVTWAFEDIGIHLEWRGKGVEERGHDKSSGKVIVEVDPRYFRPTEVDLLIGDASKANQKLGWRPETSVRDLCREMVTADLEVMRTANVIKET